MRTLAKLCLITLLIFTPTQITHAVSSEARNQIIGVRLDDVVRFIPNEIPVLRSILPTIKNELPELLSIDEEILEIHNIFFSEMPDDRWFNRTTFPITVFMKLSESGYVFIKGEITHYRFSGMIGRRLEKISLSDTSFRAEAGLIDRVLVLEDFTNDIKMVFPLGVGGFDEGVQHPGLTSLVTPRFKNAWIDKREAYATRTKPVYYAGKPFLRITTNKRLDVGYTSVGFHAQPHLAPFLRGFDSHGCIRMQTDDLIAFHRLLANGPHLHIPIKISYQNYSNYDHPAPKINTPYKTIYNVGTIDEPFFILDRDQLIQFIRVKRAPPLELLYDRYDDDYFSLYNYDSRDRLLPDIIKPSLVGAR